MEFDGIVNSRLWTLSKIADSFVTPLAINAHCARPFCQGAILSRHIAGRGSPRVMQLNDIRCGTGRSASLK
jgi:hypothetical protein